MANLEGETIISNSNISPIAKIIVDAIVDRLDESKVALATLRAEYVDKLPLNESWPLAERQPGYSTFAVMGFPCSPAVYCAYHVLMLDNARLREASRNSVTKNLTAEA